VHLAGSIRQYFELSFFKNFYPEAALHFQNNDESTGVNNDNQSVRISEKSFELYVFQNKTIFF